MNKYILIFIMTIPLCSCGPTGKLLGSVARLPVDIVRGGASTLGYQEGETSPLSTDIQSAPLHQL
tara:strand:- start:15 stop:209 length:195 start_codon:yes stop_codon:yes gene_type:complete